MPADDRRIGPGRPPSRRPVGPGGYPGPVGSDDRLLAVAAAAGDRAALAGIYDRYADRLYDLCWSILRDRHEAADAVHDTFVVASTRLAQLRDPDRLRPWLFAVARREAIARSDRRRRAVPTEDIDMTGSHVDEVDRDPGDAAALVWEAAEALTERDRAVLDLHVRHGLAGADLAAALDVEPAQAAVLLSRAKQTMGKAVGATLLARSARGPAAERCDELAAIVGGHTGPLDTVLRKRIARHADGCDRCGERRTGMTKALAMLAAAPVSVAPSDLRDRVLEGTLISSTSAVPATAATYAWHDDGFPAEPHRRRRRPIAWLAGAALVALLLGGGAVALGGDGDRPRVTPAAAPSPPSTSPTTPTSTQPAAAPPAPSPSARPPSSDIPSQPPAPRRTTDRKSEGGPGASAASPPTTTGTPPTTQAPPTTAAPVGVTASADRSRLSSAGGDGCLPTTATVTARTSGSPDSVTLRWQAPDGATGSDAMTRQPDGSWRGTLGPFDLPGDARWWVDAAGVGGGARSATRSVTVVRCT